MKSIFFQTTLLVLWSIILQAQPNNQYVLNANVPAPNAAALGKYADIPVSYFTGVPDISIPIYTVEEGPLSLPITLNYHASGVRVAENASWVGMGWSLSAGGIITRTVQGIPDETYPNGYYNSGSQVPSPSDPNLWAFLKDAGSGIKDSEIDLFTFNVAGYSGKFYIDHKDAESQGKPKYQFVPQQDLKLEFSTDFTQFVIIAPDGTRYTFGKAVINGSTVNAREITHESGQPGWKAYTSSWYLLLVESADRKFSYNLSYVDEYYEYKNLSPCTYVSVLRTCYPFNNPQQNGLPIGYQHVGGAADSYHDYTTSEITGKRLTSINYSSGGVSFLVGTSNRQDLEASQGVLDAKKLESIQISSGAIVCKKFDLTYDYFQDPGNTSAAYYKRLRLTSVQEKSCDGTITNPAYAFTYNGTFLPHRLSKATDHWGYYNGVTANDTKVVSIPATTLTDGGTGLVYNFGDANKESNGTEMQKGVLTAIAYPTGGKTYFTYEGNVVETGISTTTQLLNLVNCLSSPSSCCGTHSNNSGNMQFTAAQLSGSNTKFKLLLSAFPPGSGATCTPTTITGVVRAYLSSNPSTPIGTYSFNFNPSSSQQSASTGDQPLSLLGNFQANTNYFFQVQATDGYGTLTINTTSIITQNYAVGGLRIKQIRMSESASDTPVSSDVIQDFEYLQVNSSSASSGILYKKPLYGYDLGGTLVLNNNSFTAGAFHKLFFTEQSTTPLFDFDGFHFGYSRVKVKYNGNGEKVFNLYYTPNPLNYGTQYPYPPYQVTVSLGKTEYESTYNGSSTLIAQNHISGGGYSSSSITNASNTYKVSLTSYGCEDSYQAPIPAIGILNTYYKIYTDAFRVVSKTEMLDGVTTTTNYSYDGLNRFFSPTAVEVTNSDNKVTRTEYTYPHDLSAGCIRDSLVKKNIIIDPWQTVVKVNGAQVNGTQKIFAAYSLSTGSYSSSTTCATSTFPRVYQVKNYEATWNSGGTLSGSWILKGTFNSYDTKGMPTSFTTANWSDPETYSWRSDGVLLTKTFKSHSIVYDYYPSTRLLRSITDIDGRKTGFTYDWLMRLTKTTKDNASVTGGVVVDGNVKTEYIYHYKGNPDIYNWVKIKNTFTPVSGSGLTTTESYEYFDGLSRSTEVVKKAWSPNSKDVVTAVAYDNQNRIINKYVPQEATTNTGAYLAPSGNWASAQYSYEVSPLNRLISETPPGGSATLTAYGANTSGDAVLYGPGGSAYPANSLSKTTTTTPQSASINLQTVTFKDKKGRVVLVRNTTQGGTSNADTYSTFDDKDRVIQVLPPGVGTTDVDTKFTYTYDGADNMLTKKVPDMGTMQMRYNNKNQLVLAQDANQQPANKWFETLYDAYGRTTQTGIIVASSPDPNAPPAFNEQHTNTVYGTSGIDLGKITSIQTWQPGGGSITRAFTYSTVTGLKVTDNGGNHLNSNTGSDNYTYTYDYGGNLLTETRTHKTSSTSSTLTLTTRYTFDSKGRKSGLFYKINTGTEKQLASYAYDYRDRLIGKNLNPVVVSGEYSTLQSINYAYNDRNWLISINGPSSFSTLSQSPIALCSTNPTTPDPAEGLFQDPDGNDLFKLDLYYETPGLSFGSALGQKNGNISQLVWQTRGRERQGYSFQYDYLNRLTSSYYADINASGTASTDNKFQENITYNDARGNILSVTRNGLYKATGGATCWSLGQIDNLQYTYNAGSNRIQKIADSAPTGGTGNPQRNSGFNPGSASGSATYGYDANGNLNNDPYKAMSLTYNHLNLPTQFNFGSSKTIDILYDYSGKKLRKTVKPNASTTDYVQDYVDGLEYRTSGSGGTLTLEAIYHDEGRITPNGASYQYEYSVKDHLGNTRMTFADLNGNNVVDVPGDILQENHYYPFGMNMNYTWLNNVGMLDNRYQYNGKELNDDYGLNLSDYGARWYDASIGRWLKTDLLSCKSVGFSTYSYANNNPIQYIDPDGNTTESTHTDANGRVIAVYDDGDLGIYRHNEILSSVDMNDAKSIVDKMRLNSGETSGGGEFMGVSLHMYSFADFGALQHGLIVPKGNIDFSSHWALEAVQNIMWSTIDKSIWHYALNAGSGQKYDIKVLAAKQYGSVYYGSILYKVGTINVYASARDAGNFAAGEVQQRSILPNYITSVGFGAFNYSHNNKPAGALFSLEKLILDSNPDPFGFGPTSPLHSPYYGEDIGSAKGIEAGRSYYKNHPYLYNLNY